MTSETASVDEDMAPTESNWLGQGQSYLIGDTIYPRGAELRNPRSQAAVCKQGYRDTGCFTWTGYGPDGFENAQMFDLLATEWRAARDGVTP
jgi:hypothetical protein